MGRPIEGESFQVQVNEETLKKSRRDFGYPRPPPRSNTFYLHSKKAIGSDQRYFIRRGRLVIEREHTLTQ